jgi:hypothetical protein
LGSSPHVESENGQSLPCERGVSAQRRADGLYARAFSSGRECAAQRLRHGREGRETLPVAESGLPSRAPSGRKGPSCFLPSLFVHPPLCHRGRFPPLAGRARSTPVGGIGFDKSSAFQEEILHDSHPKPMQLDPARRALAQPVKRVGRGSGAEQRFPRAACGGRLVRVAVVLLG